MLEQLSPYHWTPFTAAHLLRRAGFGGSPSEVEALHRVGLPWAIRRLVYFDGAGEPPGPPAWMGEPGAADLLGPDELRGLDETEKRERRREWRRQNRRRLDLLRAWWVRRMVETDRPLEERLTLFWHGHFATSERKVKSAYMMGQQNMTLRAHALGNWEDFLVAVSQDPAMLVYLDNARSRKESPNENYARELMELFTLGEGHYTETDIREAARALTGWSVRRERCEFMVRPYAHDGGRKTLFGHRGDFDGRDVIRLIVDRPRSAEYICRKLWAYFAYPDPEPGIVDELVGVMRRHGNDLRPVLETMFRSRAFYSGRAYRTQIKSPAVWLVSALRTLEAPLDYPGAALAMLHTLGQSLFQPPNVKGWDQGEAWITTSTLLRRYNYAHIMAEGISREHRRPAGTLAQGVRRLMEAREEREVSGREARDRLREMGSWIDASAVLPAEYRGSMVEALEHLQWRVYNSFLRKKDRRAFVEYARSLPPPRRWQPAQVQRLVRLMMTTPQFQLT